MRKKEKYPRIGKAILMREYKGHYPGTSKIFLGKEPISRRYHQIVFQQGISFGRVGDICTDVSHEDLIELARQGIVMLYSPGNKPIRNLTQLNVSANG